MPSTSDTTPYAAFGLRIALGLVLLAHGALLKLATFGLAGTMGYFASIGYPPALVKRSLYLMDASVGASRQPALLPDPEQDRQIAGLLAKHGLMAAAGA